MDNSYFLWNILVLIINFLSVHIFFFNSCALIIFHQNTLPLPLLFLDDWFIVERAGQPVTHMTSQQ